MEFIIKYHVFFAEYKESLQNQGYKTPQYQSPIGWTINIQFQVNHIVDLIAIMQTTNLYLRFHCVHTLNKRLTAYDCINWTVDIINRTEYQHGPSILYYDALWRILGLS